MIAEPSLNTSVNVHWIYGMWPYSWHYRYWTMIECRTVRQDKCERAMDIRLLAVFLGLLVLAAERVQNPQSRLL